MRPNDFYSPPQFERNSAASEFVPSEPTMNDALAQNQPKPQYDEVTIEELRNNDLYRKDVSGLDKVSVVTAQQREHAKILAPLAANEKQAKKPKL